MLHLRTLLQAALLLPLALAVGCHAPRQAIAVIPRTTATPLWEPLHQGIVETARQTGLAIYWNAPPTEADVEQQMAMFAALQRKGYRGFILSPDETLAARTAVLGATSRGVPVVIVDDELGPPPSAKLSYVSNDEAAGALLAARRIAELLHGRGAIAITGINPRSETSLSREQQVESAMLAAAPGVRIALRRFGDTVLTHQQQIAQDLMAQPEHIDAIVALSAAATRGAYYARLAGPATRRIAIVGFDQDLLLPLQTDGIDAIVAQDTRTIGQIAMRNLASQLHGQAVQGTTLVRPLLLTRDSLQSPATRRLLDYPTFAWSTQ